MVHVGPNNAFPTNTHRSQAWPSRAKQGQEPDCNISENMLRLSPHAVILRCLNGPNRLFNALTALLTFASSGTCFFAFSNPTKSSNVCFTDAWAMTSCTGIGAPM